MSELPRRKWPMLKQPTQIIPRNCESKVKTGLVVVNKEYEKNLEIKSRLDWKANGAKHLSR